MNEFTLRQCVGIIVNFCGFDAMCVRTFRAYLLLSRANLISQIASLYLFSTLFSGGFLDFGLTVRLGNFCAYSTLILSAVSLSSNIYFGFFLLL